MKPLLSFLGVTFAGSVLGWLIPVVIWKPQENEHIAFLTMQLLGFGMGAVMGMFIGERVARRMEGRRQFRVRMPSRKSSAEASQVIHWS